MDNKKNIEDDLNQVLTFKKRDLLDIITTIASCREDVDIDKLDELRNEVYFDLNATLELHNERFRIGAFGKTYEC